MKKILYLIIFIISITFTSCINNEESLIDCKTKYVGGNSKVDKIVGM